MEKAKILVVDDEWNYREIMIKILEAKEYEVDEAENGNMAVEKVRKDSFDVILLDLNLPDINGIEVMRTIREFNETVVIIMITGCPSLDSSVEAASLGVYEYLIKPVEPAKLMQIIDESLQR